MDARTRSAQRPAASGDRAPLPGAWLTGAIASGAVLLAATLLVVARATRDLDLRITIAAQGFASPALDAAVNAHTILGQAAVAVAIAAGLALVARQRRLAAWPAPLLILLTGPAELALKYALDHPDPPDAFSRSWTAALSIPLDTPSGFPSGHVARITFLLLTAWALFPSRASAAAAGAFFAFTLFARVYIGDHWASDVLGGAALGALTGCLAALLLQRPGR